VLIACPILLVLGGLFAFFARMTALPSQSLLRKGTPAQATVVEVKALGRTLGIEKPGISATVSRVTVVLAVEPPTGASFQKEHSEYIVAGDLKFLQVGSRIFLRVDPRNPTRMAIDWDAVEM
jgi:hypothetical protein